MILKHLLGSLILLSALTMGHAFANGTTQAKTNKTAENKELEATFARFKGAKSFSLQVERTQKLMFGDDKIYEGVVEVSGNKFRWENKKPINSLMVFDGNILWNEEPPPKGIDGKTIVTKNKVNKAGEEQPLFVLLRKPGKLSDQFEIKKADLVQGDVLTYELSPKSKGWVFEELRVAISPSDNQLKRIAYKDEIGNTTVLAISNAKYDIEIPKSRFNYSPPANAEVTEL